MFLGEKEAMEPCKTQTISIEISMFTTWYPVSWRPKPLRNWQVHFEDGTHGTQTNLTTGKVRRVQKLQKGEPMPAWEGTGIRRRPATTGAGAAPNGALNSAPATSAAKQAQANREQRRGGYEANKAVQPHALRRPQVSTSAYNAPAPAAPKPKTTTSPSGPKAQTAPGYVPHYMRQLKSKS